MAIALGLGAAPCAQAQTPASGLTTWAELLKRPRPQPTRRFSYGKDPNQFVQLWQPSGLGPHPLVVMIHGGCWQASVAGLDIMDYVAADLQRRGIAVWNIEYRRVDQPGGGYPGAFSDVGAAIDLLHVYGHAYSLNLDRVVAVGHSAGGQLALWAAARPKLPPSSALHAPAPIPISAVVDLAGIADLQADIDTACGAEVITKLVGPATPAHPNVYADTSPAALLPLGVPQVVVHGAQDITVPPPVGLAYAARARAAHDQVEVITPPGAHVEEVDPRSAAWAREVQAIRALVGPNPPFAQTQ